MKRNRIPDDSLCFEPRYERRSRWQGSGTCSHWANSLTLCCSSSCALSILLSYFSLTCFSWHRRVRPMPFSPPPHLLLVHHPILDYKMLLVCFSNVDIIPRSLSFSLSHSVCTFSIKKSTRRKKAKGRKVTLGWVISPLPRSIPYAHTLYRHSSAMRFCRLVDIWQLSHFLKKDDKEIAINFIFTASQCEMNMFGYIEFVCWSPTVHMHLHMCKCQFFCVYTAVI